MLCCFQVDLEGKRAAWEGIVKIPFVDEVGSCRALARVIALRGFYLYSAGLYVLHLLLEH